MTVGATQVYDGAMPLLLANATTQWDDSTANSFAFILLDNAYTPSDAHVDYDDVLANICTDGDYAAKDVTSRVVTDGAGSACYLDSADADFGAAVTISARYLVCLKANSGSLVGTDKLIFYVDLNSGGAANVASTAAPFKVQAPTNGWLNIAQA